MYAKVIDGAVVQYPYTMQDLFTEYPSTSFPLHWTDELLAIVNLVRVVVTDTLEFDPATQAVEQTTPAYSSERSRWEQAWVVRSKTDQERAVDDEAKADEVRNDRNNRLAKTDWTQVLDAQVDRSAWAAYRQALRDISAQPGFPWTIDWPEAP